MKHPAFTWNDHSTFGLKYLSTLLNFQILSKVSSSFIFFSGLILFFVREEEEESLINPEKTPVNLGLFLLIDLLRHTELPSQ